MGRYRSWSRITSGVLLSVLGAVQYGTSKVFYKIVPHFDAQELRQYIHQVMATFSKTGKEVVMVVDRSGIHRAHKLDATLDHYHDKFRFHFLPAHCGHHLNPIEGFWRVMKDTIGAGRCFADLHAALPAHPPGADGASRASYLRITNVWGVSRSWIAADC